MRQLIYLLQGVNTENDVKQISDEIIDAFEKDSNSIDHEVDFELLDILFRLDLSLEKKANACWEMICKHSVMNKFPLYLRDYFEKILKNKPISDFVLYGKKLGECEDSKAFRYLVALCLIQEGLISRDKSKIEKALGVFGSLSHYLDTSRKNKQQLIRSKSAAKMELVPFLSIEEALECIREVQNEKDKYTLFDPLYIYQSILIVLSNAKTELDKEIKVGKEGLKKAADSYQSKNMEVLSYFIAIISFILGVGGIVYKIEAFSNQLMFLVVLAVNIIFILALMVTMLRVKWVAYCISMLGFIIAIIGCGILVAA